MLKINNFPYSALLLFFISGISHPDTTDLFSLRDAVEIGVKSNKIEVPLIRVNQTIAFCDFKASRSTFGTLEASGDIALQYDGSFLTSRQTVDTLTGSGSPNPYSFLTTSGALKSVVALPTGGILNAGVSVPVTQSLIPDTPVSKIPLAGTVQLEQPLSPSIIKQKRFDRFLEKDRPRRIGNQTRTELEMFILQLASRYYQYSSLQNQLLRARKNAGQSRQDADVAQLKFKNGAISKTSLAEIEAMREESELTALTIASTLVTSRRDMEDLVGIGIDSVAVFSGIDEDDLSLPPPDSILSRALAESELLQSLRDNVTSARLRNRFSAIFAPSLLLSYMAIPNYGQFGLGDNASNQVASAAMNIPLISLREGRIALQKAAAEAQKADLLYKQGHRQISRTVADLYRAVVDLRVQIDVAQKNVIASRTSLDLAREQFVAGTISRATLDLYIAKLESGERQLEESKAQQVIAHLGILQVQRQLLPFFGIKEEGM